jgi:hypothetical protein
MEKKVEDKILLAQPFVHSADYEIAGKRFTEDGFRVERLSTGQENRAV